MTTRINVTNLDRELAIRGLNGRELSRLAGISAMTLSNARQGHRVRESTVRRLAVALTRVEPIPGAAALVDHDGTADG
jgi:transcriptional regulator with XRE-family HTH domain